MRMAGINKLTKKLLQSANIINTGSAPLPAAPTPASLPVVAPEPVPLPLVQAQAAVSAPTSLELLAARRDRLAKFEATGAAGRAGTILSKRKNLRRSEASLLDGAGGGAAAPTYTNDTLGK